MEREANSKPLTYAQLEKACESAADAKWLIDNNKLVKTKNSYGQDAWWYCEESHRRIDRGGMRTAATTKMKLDEEQTKHLIGNMCNEMPDDYGDGRAPDERPKKSMKARQAPTELSAEDSLVTEKKGVANNVQETRSRPSRIARKS